LQRASWRREEREKARGGVGRRGAGPKVGTKRTVLPAVSVESPVHTSVFFFCKWQSSIGRCRKNGDHPYEHLAKIWLLNQQIMKYNHFLLNFLYLWLHAKNQISFNSGDFYYFSPTSGD
jgi:hypothetical protein